MSNSLPRFLAALLATSFLGGGALAHGAVIRPAPYPGPPAPGRWKGPSELPTSPSGPSGPSSPSGPNAPASPSGPSGSGGPATGGPRTGGIATGESDPYGFATWEAWWHFNKDPFLELKRAVTRNVRTAGADDLVPYEASGIPGRDLVRTRIVPALLQLLEDDRANDVTTGALIALARIGEPADLPEASSAIPRMVRALADPNQEVAETAALSLGILRAEAGISTLTDLLEGGERGRKLVGGKDVDARTRAFAAFGLGLAAERAPQNRTRQLIARSLIAVLDDRKAKREVHVACVLALSLDRIDPEAVESSSAPWISRQTVLRKLIQVFSDGDRDHLVRAHAATAVGRLAQDAPPELRSTALELFVSALKRPSRLENEVVNSCIQVLGILADTSLSEPDRAARAALIRALDDGDPQARAFAMIALAEVGARLADATGTESAEIECRSALVNEILRGRSTSKSWAVIALGLHERRRADRGGLASENARQVLLDWLGNSRGRNEVGSGAIALGLCRETRAARILTSKLAATNDDTGQGYVALALGMIGHVDSVPALRGVVQGARYKPTLLAQAAEALALLGDRENSPTLAREIGEARGAAAQAAIAGALGFIGDTRSVDPLLALIARKDLSASARGLAAAALGRIADESLLPWHTSISSGLNYRAATESLIAGDGTGLLELL
ncbi:MAG: HEAT repeat domain-containing protein [Planctomycetota bacterium]